MRFAPFVVAAVLVGCAAGARGAETPLPPPIVFASGRPDGDITTFTARGRERRLVTSSARSDRAPSWSPQGTRVAFTGFEGSRAHIHILDLRTGESENIVRGSNPDWSPDGHRLAFVSETADDLATMNADGTDRRTLGLTAYGIRWTTDPAWSPDGRRIAFAGHGLYTANPDGSDVRVLRAETGSGPGRVTWSPDGTRLAYDCLFLQVCLIGADGNGGRPIVQRGSSPSWSPDGTLIAMENGLPWPLTILVRPDGTRIRSLGSGEHPDWSPGGRQLVAVLDRGGGLYAALKDGAGLKRLTAGPGDAAPAWSPEGHRLAFRSWHRQRCDLALEDLRTSRIRVIVRGTRDRLCRDRPEWSPDGRRIVYGSRGNLWSVPARGGRPRRITSIRSASTRLWESWPRFAPDGRSIGFAARGRIWLLHPTGRRSLVVRASGPFAWSHDGRKLAYLRRRCQTCNWHLYVRERGHAPRRLFNGVDVGLAWSPDDRLIAVTRSDPPGSGGTPALFVVDLKGVATRIFDDATQPDWRSSG
jgi:TolB protein